MRPVSMYRYGIQNKGIDKEKGYTQEQFAQMTGATRVSLVKTLSGDPSYEALKFKAHCRRA